MEQVILVDQDDVQTGTMEKMEAHQKALLHRAFSVFIFNDSGEMLLQQRALTKYHSGGLWTNACCSHPKPNETTIEAATRRLQEELGFTTSLTKAFHFTYKAVFDNGLTEHEFDHVFIGKHNGKVAFNFEEVENYAYRSIAQIDETVAHNGHFFTEWFLIAYPLLKDWLKTNGLPKL